MVISLDKILTISAKEWFEITGNNPRNYEAEVVHYYAHASGGFIDEKFRDSIPSNAEVVVSYKCSSSADEDHTIGMFLMSHASGTALIPKSKPK